LINSAEEAIYKDRLNKSKENTNDKSYLLKTEKKNELTNSIMSIVKENIEEENKDVNKDANNDINIKDNIEDNKNDNKNDNTNNNIDNDINKMPNINNDKIDEKKESDPIISHMNMQGNITEDEINNASKIILEEIDGNLFNGEKIEINAGGMVGGRGKKDGFTIFGQKNGGNANNNSNEDKFKPDFELNYSEYLPYPYIFTVYYKKEEKAYYIRAFSGKGSDNKILFIKLNNNDKFILKQKELISAGDAIFQISPISNNFLEIIHLKRKKNPNNTDNKLIFEGIKNKKVTLGRSKDCDFSFPKDKSFSRFQTSFVFDDDKKEWYIIDGKGDKSSTNGTWIFGTHSFLIENEMIIEVLNSKIKIKEIKKEENNENNQNNQKVIENNEIK
jgi:hypothetical protein